MFPNLLLFLSIFLLPNRSSTITSFAKTNENEETEILHLPDNVVPQQYELWMTPSLSTATFRGGVDITIAVIYATHTIKLHSKNLKIKKYKLRKLDTQVTFTEITIDFDKNNDLLLITTEEKLLPGSYVLSLTFEGVLNDDLVGFYRSSYLVNNEIKWLAITQFEPNHAREAFPCFDEPRFKTPFVIYLACSQNQKTVSNMPIREINADHDTTTNSLNSVTHETTPAIPTHLVAFMVSELASTSVSSSTSPKISLHSAENVESKTQYFLKQSEKLFQEITDFTGVKYALDKIDFVAVPDLKMGATHHLGMPTLREIYTILDEQSCAEIQKTMATLAASHIIACHWFAGLVYPNWWDSAWIVRGLAIHFEYFMSARNFQIEPTWNLEELFSFEEVQSTLWTEIEYQRAMASEITKPSEMESMYSVVSGDKAACVFRMLESLIKTEGFKCGLKEYLENGKNLYQDTNPSKALFRAFEEQTCHNPELPTGISLSQILRTWTDNIGFPLITAIKDPDTKTWTLKQITYKSPRAAQTLPDQEWIVPITYTTKSDSKSQSPWKLVWSIGSTPVELSQSVENSDWVLCNLQQTGYYRVNYEDTNWNLLIKQLNEDKDAIPVINRAQLVDDSFALAFDGKLSYTIPLQLAKYLKTETHLLPWLSATFHFDLILSERDHSDAILVQTYIKDLIKIILTSNPRQTHLYKVTHPIIASLACKLEMKEYVDDIVFTEWNNNGEDLSKIDPNLQGLVFCKILATSNNPQAIYNKLWILYKTTDSSYLRTLILSKLGCVKNENILKKLLEKLLISNDEDIKNADKNILVNSFLQSPTAIQSFLTFLRELLPKLELDDHAIYILQSLALNLETKNLIEQHLEQVRFLKYELQNCKENRYAVLKNSIENSLARGIRSKESPINRINDIEKALEKIKDF